MIQRTMEAGFPGLEKMLFESGRILIVSGSGQEVVDGVSDEAGWL